MLVADCPRCGSSSITFDAKAQVYLGKESGWSTYYELFCVCRNCRKSTVFVVQLNDYRVAEVFEEADALVLFERTLNPHFGINGHITLKDNASVAPPEHVPADVAEAFKEAATCLAVQCYNAAGTMFRLAIDLATRPLLPNPDDQTVAQPNQKQRRDLGLRLSWLFDNQKLPETLRELASCIREDGNDGAHAGSLTKEDAEDLLDFATSLLERLFTEPERLRLAQERRQTRRAA
jgi:hypothetical protein